MSDLTVVTNNVPRLLIDSYELSPREREEFDYLDWTAIDNGEDSATFFRYRGSLYDLGEFSTTYGMPENEPLRKWDGYQADTFFSATVIRYVADDSDYVVVGRIYS